MVTSVVKTVGITGRNYANLTQFEAALPADMTAVGTNEQWTAQLYNDGLILENGGATVVFSSVTDFTHYVRLEAAPGHSFMDHDFTTDALAYNPAFGVAVESSHGVTFASTLQLGAACDFFQADGIQFRSTDLKARAIRLKSGASHLLTNCILESNGKRAHSELEDGVTRNCLLIHGSSGGSTDGPSVDINSHIINCTIVVPSDLTTARKGINGNTAVGQVENCVLFGFPNAISVNLTGDFNASDLAAIPGAGSKASLVYASQFVSVLDASQDWKVKDSSADIASGGASAAGTGSDILGNARAAQLVDRSIGAYELPSGGVGGSAVLTGGGTLAAVSSKNAATGLAITATGIVSAQVHKQAAGGGAMAGGGGLMAAVRKLAAGSGIISVAGGLGAGARKLAAATALLTGGGSMMATGGPGGATISPDPVALAALAETDADLAGLAAPFIALGGVGLLIESF